MTIPFIEELPGEHLDKVPALNSVKSSCHLVLVLGHVRDISDSVINETGVRKMDLWWGFGGHGGELQL
jgi:hypothetical protein